MTTKLIHRPTDKADIELHDDERIRGRSRAAIVAETVAEKAARKLLAKKRQRERLAEQQHIVKHMENLMDKVVELDVTLSLFYFNDAKVLREKTLSKTDENNLRNEINTIISRVQNESDRAGVSTLTEPSSSQVPGDVGVSHRRTPVFYCRSINSLPNRLRKPAPIENDRDRAVIKACFFSGTIRISLSTSPVSFFFSSLFC